MPEINSSPVGGSLGFVTYSKVTIYLMHRSPHYISDLFTPDGRLISVGIWGCIWR